MSKIIMHGWQEGMKKVSLTKLQNTLLKIPLKESKDNVDRLLSDHIIVIDVSDRLKAVEFVKEAVSLGVTCILED